LPISKRSSVRGDYTVTRKTATEQETPPGSVRYDAIEASVASIPARKESLRVVVQRILPQVDRLHVYLNNYPRTPSWLKHAKIDVAHSRDHGDRGDAGKFFWCDSVAGYHFTLDDDLLYPPDYVATMIEKIEDYGRHAVVTAHGSMLREPFNGYLQSRDVYSFCGRVRTDTPVHIPGTGCLAYHTETLTLYRSDFAVANLADVWFALAAKRQQTPLVVVAHPEQWIVELPRGQQTSIYRRTLTDDSPITALLKDNMPWPRPRLPLPAPSTGRPRLLHVYPFDFVMGGTERFIYEMCNQTFRLFDNHVLVPWYRAKYRFNNRNAALHVVARSLPHLVQEVIAHLSPDVLIHHHPYDLPQARYGAFLPESGRVIGVMHSDQLGNADLPACTWARPRKLIAMAPQATPHAGWQGVDIAPMRLGVNLARYRKVARPENSTPTACIVARLDKNKIPPSFLKALQRKGLGDWRIDVIGEAYTDYGRQCAEALRAIPGVRVMAPYEPDFMNEVYPRYDALLVPSLSEGGSYVIGEAMACGLPIVARRVGGIPYATGGHALLGRSDDELLDLLQRLSATPLRAAWSAKASEGAASLHDLREQTTQFVRIIQEIL